MPHNHPNLPKYFAVQSPGHRGEEIIRWFIDHGYSNYEGYTGIATNHYYGISSKNNGIISLGYIGEYDNYYLETVRFTYDEWKERLNEVWVECVDDDVMVGKITIGKRYKVLNDNGKYYTIIDDLGNEHGFFLSRFKIVSTPSVQKKKIIGYKMIKLFPFTVCEIGHTITDPEYISRKDYGKWPEFWEPQYEPEKPKEIILTLGNPKPREIRITKDKIEAKSCYGNWKDIPVANVESIMRLLDLSNEFKGKIKSFEVDGTLFTMEDVFKVWETKLSFND